MSEEGKGFTVKDRRMFSGEESEKSDKEKKPEADAKKSGPKSPQQRQSTESRTVNDRAAETPLPEVNFPTFVISLNASALVHLGAIEDPATGVQTKNLPMAKQTIDILSMLEEKTRGNLTKDEENILKNVLYDLRIAYVKEKE